MRVRAMAVTIVLVAGFAVLALWRSTGTGGDGPCTGQVRLTIAAAPEIAPVLSHVSARWAEGARGSDGECVAVDVSAAEPADVALAVANGGGVALAGLTPLAPAAPVPDSSASPSPTVAAPATPVAIPDVWLPDSSTWLVRVRAAGPGLVPPQAPSVATSPVVLAVPEPVAGGLGWPTQLPTWESILQQLTAGASMHLGLVEPNRDAVGLGSLVALGTAAAAAGTDPEATTVAVMRALFTGRAADEGELLGRFPTAADQEALGAALTAAPLAERSLISYNSTGPAVPLAAVYVQPAPPALDYPWAVMPGIAAERVRLADELLGALTGERYIDELAAVGLRGPDGTAGFPAMPGSPATIATGQLDGAAVARALATWISVTRPARMLAVMDVSGSMNLPVPTAGGASRSQIATEAARQGMLLFDDSWSVGLWAFATNLDGNIDHREIVPIRPMTENRPALVAALQTVRPDPNGYTGLYDTVLAAYQEVRDGWDPVAVNSVVLLTDGQNDDPDGISLDELIASLQAIIDPRYPVQVIAIGIGDDVSQDELERITNTTGGGTFIARDPSAIGPIFLKAISLRPPAPPA
jgi:Ca-activated chloride channel homolog